MPIDSGAVEIHLMEVFQRGIDGGNVLVNDFFTLLGVGLGNSFLDIANGFVSRDDVG